MKTKVLCNINCIYNREGVCKRKEIAISLKEEGGCVMYHKHKPYVSKSVPPEEEPASLR